MSDPRRKVLKEAVCLLVAEAGFAVANEECIETLVEMLQSLICEISNQTKNYAELAGRTQAVVGDVLMSLVNLGLDFKNLDKYALREGRPTARSLSQNKNQTQIQILQAGTKPSNPSHIPNYLPQLPDAHAYIRTATYKQPETEYEAIREKSANQKRDIDKALTKFLAKSAPETHNLFDDEENQMFPLIASKPTIPSYLCALNPCDQIFDWEELEYYYLVANRKPSDDNTDSEPEESAQDEIEASPPKKRKNKNKSVELKTEKPAVEPKVEASPPKELEAKPQIDNPFLKSMKIAQGQ